MSGKNHTRGRFFDKGKPLAQAKGLLYTITTQDMANYSVHVLDRSIFCAPRKKKLRFVLCCKKNRLVCLVPPLNKRIYKGFKHGGCKCESEENHGLGLNLPKARLL